MEEPKKDLKFVNEQIVKPSKAKRILKSCSVALMGILVLLNIVLLVLWSMGKVTLAPEETTHAPYVTLVPKTTKSSDTTKESGTKDNARELTSKQLKELAVKANRAVVTVQCYKKQPAAAGDMAQSITSGIIVKKDSNIFILTDYTAIKNSGYIQVVFRNNKAAKADIRKEDSMNGLVILTVPASELDNLTMVTIEEITLGNSLSMQNGNQAIYLGNPINESRYIDYGMVTSSEIIPVTDGQRHVYYTNITLAGSSNGFFIDVDGCLVGIANGQYQQSNQKVLSFLGISDLANTIERLSNGMAPAYMGIRGQEVTKTIIDSTGEPMSYGIYVLDTDADSPAYQAGVRSGDIIIEIEGKSIYTLQDMMTVLKELDEGDTLTMVVNRPESGGYKAYKIDIILEGVSRFK